MTADLAAAALIDRGLAVFPLPPGARRPDQRGWSARCTTNPADVRSRWPAQANIGVGCRASGVVVLDLDRHAHGPDGVAAFTELCARHQQPLPRTLRVRTPHGQHLFLRVPAGGPPIDSSSGTASPFGPGIDVRAPGQRTGGYVVGAGSVVDGVRYEIDQDHDIADLPAWLAALLLEEDR
ncbi:bifunctional DNA primase/polymerase [Kutzneria buriramensis]|uniref:Bifunctional DNA primase/polymerase-like protein n=1 Tax=Kutzneria buriramensis TaxID=1045776 RepID=A0A3E0G717_9PSEU|nr:bifunctional DNA primase/polymerase [Kutzneria buriramensis]REH18017.1 bifunctional DNA primase/polymerase-like protein [Kutzneria buriramensis]